MSTMSSRKEQLERNATAALEVAVDQPPPAPAGGGQRAGLRRDPTLFTLAIDRIRPDEEQVRKEGKSADDPAIQELAADIKANGILQPLGVRYVSDGDYYKLVAGERRYIAAKIASFDAVPVKVHEVDDATARRLQLAENIHRKDLAPLELAAALQDLIDQGENVASVAKIIHKSETFVKQALTVARRLSPQAKAEAKGASLGHLYEIAQLPPEQQVPVLQKVQQERVTRDDLRRSTHHAKKAARAEGGQRRGRPSKSKPYAKTFTAENGARLTITFRKTRATTHEVIEALEQITASLKRQAAA